MSNHDISLTSNSLPHLDEIRFKKFAEFIKNHHRMFIYDVSTITPHEKEVKSMDFERLILASFGKELKGYETKSVMIKFRILCNAFFRNCKNVKLLIRTYPYIKVAIEHFYERLNTRRYVFCSLRREVLGNSLVNGNKNHELYLRTFDLLSISYEESKALKTVDEDHATLMNRRVKKVVSVNNVIELIQHFYNLSVVQGNLTRDIPLYIMAAMLACGISHRDVVYDAKFEHYVDKDLYSGFNVVKISNLSKKEDKDFFLLNPLIGLKYNEFISLIQLIRMRRNVMASKGVLNVKIRQYFPETCVNNRWTIHDLRRAYVGCSFILCNQDMFKHSILSWYIDRLGHTRFSAGISTHIRDYINMIFVFNDAVMRLNMIRDDEALKGCVPVLIV